MLYVRNRYNTNLYKYPSEEARNEHQSKMDEDGFKIYREWEERGIGRRTTYFCEFKEIGKA